MIKVVLVDDHEIVRDGIKSLINSSSHIEVIDEASDAYELFEKLKTLKPNVVVLDISLPKMTGIEAAAIITRDFPDIRILMLSMHIKEDFILNSIKAGAKGYLPKNTTKLELQSALEAICRGEEYFNEQVSQILAKSYINKAKGVVNESDEIEDILTKREIEILKLIAESHPNKDIADKLFISIRTVETHKTNIMQKLNLNTTVDLVKIAIKFKLIDL